MREQGVNATGISNWRAIFAPKGLSAAQVAYWDGALARMAASGEWNSELDGTNMSRLFLRGRDFSRYLDEEYAATRAIMADLGLVK
jgi:putative tricarboxylic transport membrane protein